MKKNSKEQIAQLTEELSKYIEKCSDFEKQMKSQSESFIQKERAYETELALLKQQVEFAQVETQ